MGKKEFKITAILGLFLSLAGCATVNYTYRGKPCENVLETDSDVVLKCTKMERVQHEPRDRR